MKNLKHDTFYIGFDEKQKVCFMRTANVGTPEHKELLDYTTSLPGYVIGAIDCFDPASVFDFEDDDMDENDDEDDDNRNWGNDMQIDEVDHLKILRKKVQNLKEAMSILIDISDKMRDAQKNYLKKKTKQLLNQAERYEYIFDEKIKGIKARINVDNAKQLSLFK